MASLGPPRAVLGQRRVRMRVELRDERRVLVRCNMGSRSRDGAGIEMTQLPPLLHVARDRVIADAEPFGHFLVWQTGLHSVNDLLAEVGGIGLHSKVNSTPLLLRNGL